MTFRRISIEIRLLYVPFGKCLSDVDRIAFSAYRTRFSVSEYTDTTPPKIGRNSCCAATTFWGLNARVRASEIDGKPLVYDVMPSHLALSA